MGIRGMWTPEREIAELAAALDMPVITVSHGAPPMCTADIFLRNNPICTVCNKRHSEDADCPND
jgi:hypothetical protein